MTTTTEAQTRYFIKGEGSCWAVFDSEIIVRYGGPCSENYGGMIICGIESEAEARMILAELQAGVFDWDGLSATAPRH